MARARRPLTRERILEAALKLVDEDGLEALTMRRLGERLGFEAMSLYNHVANKDAVLDGIIDLVLAETEPPSPRGDWAKAIRKSAISVYEALRRHPWACGLLMSPGRIRAARLRYMDLLLGRLREAGFSADTTYHAYHVLDAHIFGFSLWQAGYTTTAGSDLAKMAATFDRMIQQDEYPYLHEHGLQHLNEGPHQDVSAFEVGLDFILAGLEKVRAAEKKPAHGPAGG
jgi:AcrR family transcriptional regulator